MAGTTLELDTILQKDELATDIARKFQTWNMLRSTKEQAWKEVREYVYQTDTTQTTANALPWKNKTTLPKLCQISDNLFANYMATLFPKRKWVQWEGADRSDEIKQKREAIEHYMTWVTSQRAFKEETAKLVMDYIHYGNAIVTVDWIDETREQEIKTQHGYVGPMLRRIAPTDIVFNPINIDFATSPKIVRSFLSFGDLRLRLDSLTANDNQEELESLWDYLMDVRQQVTAYGGDNVHIKDDYFQMDGFTSFQQYLEGDYFEILTMYGNAFDASTGTVYPNHEIMVVDRHKVVYTKPNPSFFSNPPIYHSGWRIRQDNLWAMGPLDNLVGLQYRIDHLENLKADLFDLTAFPLLKIKGMVDDFEWRPMEKIYVGDEGDVELMSPDVNALNVNLEIQEIERKMEEMAGSPREAMGIRTPGEKTKYEVQRLENAASRLFQSKINQFSDQIMEPALNAMLEVARRKMTETTIRIFNDEFKSASFKKLTPEDITGAGRIFPVAARHFAEKAELVQNLSNFRNSAAGADPAILNHFSTIKEAKMWEEILEIEDWQLVQENVRILEAADAQRMMNSSEEEVLVEQGTPAGIAEDDFDPTL